MSLRTEFGYPLVLVGVGVGSLRQLQRWLPQYELVSPAQLGYYGAVMNLLVLLVGAVGAFAVGVRASKRLTNGWDIQQTAWLALVGSVVGVLIGTFVTFAIQPAHNTVTSEPAIAFVASLTLFTVTEGVPIGLAGLAGLALHRIRTLEARNDSLSVSTSSNPSAEPAEDSEPKAVADGGDRPDETVSGGPSTAESDSPDVTEF